MPELFGFDCYSPKEIAERVENIGVTKANLPVLSMVALGVLAGGFIGLGAMFFTLVVSDASLGFAVARVLGGVAFSLGLVLVVVAGAELFTGNNLLVMATVAGRIPASKLFQNLVVVYLANLVGAAGLAGLVALSGHWKMGDFAVGKAALNIAAAKCALPTNQMVVRRVFLGGERRDLEELKTTPPGSLLESFLAVARFCHNLNRTGHEGRIEWMGDPLETALVEMAEAVAPGWSEQPRLAEIPFDSKRRRLSTVNEGPLGPVLFMKGAPEAVLPLCEKVQTAAGAEPLTAAWVAKVTTAQNAMADEGLRVLALAWRPLAAPEVTKFTSQTRSPKAESRNGNAGCQKLEEHLTLAGIVGLEDPPRPEVPAAVARCREAGLKVIMVTGDHPHTALAIAREIGLVQSAHPIVITGDQLRRLSNIQLQLALDAPEIHFARVAADQKMRIVAALQRKKEIVAVTGDGVNDAPALKQADIGIAMGRSGTDVARESADMILLDDNFATIVAAIEEGRAVYANIRKFLTYILTSNIPELVPYLAFVLFKIPLPLTIIQILAVDLGTDMVPALALGAEPSNPQTMRQPPRPRAERLLNFALIARAYLWLGPIQAAAAMAAFFFVLQRGGWSYGELLGPNAPLYFQATTACLSAIIVMQVANVFLCRSRRESAFRFGLFSNPLLLLGIGAELTLILLIDYTPLGHVVFGTASIPVAAWLFIVPFALTMVLLEEVRKWLVHGRHAQVEKGMAVPIRNPV